LRYTNGQTDKHITDMIILIVMALYGSGEKRWIQYDSVQNIAKRYDTIRSQNARLYFTVYTSKSRVNSHRLM